MRVARACADDTGSAAIEFIAVGVILLVPIVYLIIALGQIQEHALGVETGARHLARSIAADGSADPDDQAARTERIMAAVAEEYGMDPDEVTVVVRCAPIATSCPIAGATVRVVVTARVTLPLVPPVLGLDGLVAVPVEAVAVQRVSAYWGEE